MKDIDEITIKRIVMELLYDIWCESEPNPDNFGSFMDTLRSKLQVLLNSDGKKD